MPQLKTKPHGGAIGRGAWCAVLGLWFTSVALGVGALDLYENRPGAEGVVPDRWSAATGPEFAKSKRDRSHLLVFVHPQCPCTAATIEQLDRILAAAGKDAPTVQVWVYRPADASPEFIDSGLVSHARRIPGVETCIDTNGETARRFGAQTSGVIRLYDSGGRLLFAGGITASRGHAGDNQGADDLLAMIRTQRGEARSAPVYGCPLVSDE